jgi:hypothetical protein
MEQNLLSEKWTQLDSFELRLLLNIRIPGRGQTYDSEPNKLYLPLAGSDCRIGLTFRDSRILAIWPGPAFDPAEWETIRADIDASILNGPPRVGRNYSFSSYRVTGWWRGNGSGVQILPPPHAAPRADPPMADHPFILEFPIAETCFPVITDYRRLREHRRLTLLLGLLLRGRTTLQVRRSTWSWARVPANAAGEIEWVEQFFDAPLDDDPLKNELVKDELSPPSKEQIEPIAPEEYYNQIGHDGGCLRIPSDLDETICRYLKLSPASRAKFDRAAFWIDAAHRQSSFSLSSSFASLVSAVEALTNQGTTHHVFCKKCNADRQHDMPGATENFRGFLEEYAPGDSLRSRRSQIYQLRSRIFHGDRLMLLDEDIAFGWDPPSWNERQLHWELWELARSAVRNWLKTSPGN